MRIRSLLVSAGMVSLVSLLMVGGAVPDEPSTDPKSGDGNATADVADTADEGAPYVSGENKIPPVTLSVARDRANLLHEVYASTLDVMHRRYFHGDRAIVPARAMEDVFSDMERQFQIEARWISVTFRAMSINHEPETEFEKLAAREIKSGKSEVEIVQAGYYRRAVAIPLTGGCASCHDGLFSQSTRKPFAGLVISIPVDGTQASEDDAPAN